MLLGRIQMGVVAASAINCSFQLLSEESWISIQRSNLSNKENEMPEKEPTESEPSSNAADLAVESRIRRTLVRVGFGNVVCRSLGGGRVEIAGISKTDPDWPYVAALVRTCAGVTEFTMKS